jgi:hypothetical protein
MTDNVTPQNTDFSSWDTLYNQLSYQVHTGKTEEIFGHKRDEEIEDWWKLHIKKGRDLYFSQKVMRVIKYSRVSRVCGTERRIRDMHTGFWWEKLKGRDHLEEISLDGKIIKLVLKEIRC